MRSDEDEAHDGLGLADLVRSGDTTARELVACAIERIEARNSALNAVVNGMFAAARQAVQQNPDSADKYAGRILDETDRLGHLVDQVLDLAALERGVAALNAQPGDRGRGTWVPGTLIPELERARISRLVVEDNRQTQRIPVCRFVICPQR